MRAAFTSPHRFIIIHCNRAYIRYDCVPIGSIQMRMAAVTSSTHTPPLSDIYVNIINLFSLSPTCGVRWIEIGQTEEPTKKRNLVDFISIQKIIPNPSACARSCAWVRCIRNTHAAYRSMFNLHIYFIYFEFFIIIFITCIAVRCSMHFSSSSFLRLVFTLSFNVYPTHHTAEQSSLGKCWKKCNWFDQLFNLANCVQTTTSLSRADVFLLPLTPCCGRSDRTQFRGQSQYPK